MNGVLVDSCVLLDLFTADPVWLDWSEQILFKYSQTDRLFINPMIYTEISIGFEHIEELETTLTQMNIKMLEIPQAALFLAGKTFLRYRKNKGTKNSPLPDFFIGAHAAVSQLKLITRDVTRFKTYFPQVELIFPNSE